MNKKRILFLLGLSAALGMTGCGNKEKETAETEFSTAAPEETAVEDLDTNEMLEEADETNATEETLEPITPSDYLPENLSTYLSLGDLSDLKATEYIYEVSDDMIQAQIEEELELYAEEIETDRASADGDVIYLDLTSTVNGETNTESTYFYLGSQEYGAEFDEQLIGLTTGDSKEFSITFDDEIWIEEWANQTVDFKAEITSVCELSIPEYNDTFAAEYTDYETIAEYEASLKESLTEEYSDLAYSDAVEALFDAAAEQTVFSSYPEDLYETCKEELLSTYFAFTGSDDVEDVYELFGLTEDSLDAEVQNSVNRRLLVSAICQEQNLELTEEDYVSYVTDYAEYYGYDNAASFESEYSREYLVWFLYESMAADYLYNEAEITKVPYEEDGLSDEVLEDEIFSEDEELLEDDTEATETLES